MKRIKQDPAASNKERESEFKVPEPPTNKVLKSTGFAVYRKDKVPTRNLSIMSFLTSKKPVAEGMSQVPQRSENQQWPQNYKQKSADVAQSFKKASGDVERQGIFKQSTSASNMMANHEEPRPSTRLQDLVSQHLQPQQGEPESFCMTKCKHVMPKKYGVKGFIVDLVSLQLRSDLKQLQDKLAKERPQLFLVCNQQNASKLDQEILRPGNLIKILDPVFMN